jgi:hypothetical protein
MLQEGPRFVWKVAHFHKRNCGCLPGAFIYLFIEYTFPEKRINGVLHTQQQHTTHTTTLTHTKDRISVYHRKPRLIDLL